MTRSFSGKRILLGVTGSIAAYKSADLVRRLKEAGALVRVAMTENAKRFITPLTMQAVSGYPVHDDLFDTHAEAAMGHIELARWADLILVAPATADFMAKLAKGAASDLLSTVCLAAKAPLVIAPAMNQGMWNHAFTQDNLQVLQHKKVHIVGPVEGEQACGDVGFGRMMEPSHILEQIEHFFQNGLLSGLRILLTAGPTHEAIDPVRFISNRSSGKMGFALAEAARAAGAEVTLVSGPVTLVPPENIAYVPVVTAQEMYMAVMRKMTQCDIFLAVAAVSDYRCQTVALQKCHKTKANMTLALEQTTDIIAAVGQLPDKPFIVGFAAETENVIEQAKAKRIRKNMDMIVANDVSAGAGMGQEDNAVTVLGPELAIFIPRAPKHLIAQQIMAIMAKEFHSSRKIGIMT